MVANDSDEKAKNRSILAEAASILFLLSAIVCLFLFFFSSFSLSLSLFPPSPLRDLLSGVVDATDYYCSPSMHARMIRQTELDCFSVPLHPFRTPFVRSLFVHHVKQVFRINANTKKKCIFKTYKINHISIVGRLKFLFRHVKFSIVEKQFYINRSNLQFFIFHKRHLDKRIVSITNSPKRMAVFFYREYDIKFSRVVFVYRSIHQSSRYASNVITAVAVSPRVVSVGNLDGN